MDRARRCCGRWCWGVCDPFVCGTTSRRVKSGPCDAPDSRRDSETIFPETNSDLLHPGAYLANPRCQPLYHMIDTISPAWRSQAACLAYRRNVRWRCISASTVGHPADRLQCEDGFVSVALPPSGTSRRVLHEVYSCGCCLFHRNRVVFFTGIYSGEETGPFLETDALPARSRRSGGAVPRRPLHVLLGGMTLTGSIISSGSCPQSPPDRGLSRSIRTATSP